MKSNFVLLVISLLVVAVCIYLSWLTPAFFWGIVSIMTTINILMKRKDDDAE